MKYKNVKTIIYMMICLICSGRIIAQNVADPLLNKLIEKGVIESYEAQEVRNEISNVIKKQLDEEKKKEEEQKNKDKYKLKTGGYFQLMYTLDETTSPVSSQPGHYRDPIYIRRARVSFKQQIADWISFTLTPEFAKCADPLEVSNTTVVSSTSPYRTTQVVSRVSRVPTVELKGAYVEFNFNDFLNFRLGQFNQPFGFENVYSSSKKIFPNDAVQYMNKNVLHSDYDFGLLYFLKYKKLASLELAALNGTTYQRETNNKKDLLAKVVLSGDLFLSDLKGVEVSYSYYDRYYGEIITSTVTPKNGQHYNAYIKLEKTLLIPVFLTFEYVWGKNETLVKDVENLITTLEIKPFEKTILKGLSPSLRYESWDPNKNTSNDELEVYTIGLNYYPHKNVRLLLDYRMPKEKPSDLANNRLNFMVQVSY